MSLTETWQLFDTTAREKKLTPSAPWKPGFTPEQMSTIEARTGCKLPDDAREYFTICGGNEDLGSIYFAPWYFQEYPRLIANLETCASLSAQEQTELDQGDKATDKPDQGVRPTTFSTKRVPIMDDFAGNFHYIDMDPAEGGTYGQIICVIAESAAHKLLAPSITDYFRILAEELQNGNLYWNVNTQYPDDSGFLYKPDTQAARIFAW